MLVYNLKDGLAPVTSITNMFKFSLLALLALSLILAVFLQAETVESEATEKQSESLKACTRELEGIIYKPPTPKYFYLKGLSEQFIAGSPIIFASPAQADAFVLSFAQRYDIEVTLTTPLGESTNYYPNGNIAAGSPPKYTDTAQSYLNLGGFVWQTSNQKYYYTFAIYSADARRYGVTLALEAAEQMPG